tara:strand:+ start:3226 stop:3417 length:192 start_codon:yes stop_codon:yes gene_type:complete
MNLGWIKDALEVAETAFSIGKAIVSAVKSGDREKVDAILSGELKTSLAKAAAYAEAAEKFGGE